MTAVQILEQDVASLKNALVVAMEEVDQLRSQVFAETGKLQREFRETVDAVVRSPHHSSGGGGNTVHHVQRLFESPSQSRGGGGAGVDAKLEYLELAVRALQERRDSTPAAVDALMQQMRRWTDNADASARQLEHRVSDALSASEQKSRAWAEERIRESEQSLRRSLTARVDQHEAAIRDQEGKIQALTTVVANIDKRLHAAEEGLSQLDAEQHEVTSALQGVREQTKVLLRSPPRRASGPLDGEMDSYLSEQSAVIREEVLHAVDNKLSQHQRRSPPNASVNTSHVATQLEQRAIQQDVQGLRQDVVRCVAHIERLMDEQQRLSQAQHTNTQAVQRVEQLVDGARDRLELDLKTELQRFDTMQKTFFSRQEQLLNSERHQLGVKVSADLQRMHQRQVEELQKSELRRFDDIRSAQSALREEFLSFADRQRDELHSGAAALEERNRRVVEELKTYVEQEVTQQTDATKKNSTHASEEFRKMASRTMDELKRVKQIVEDQSAKSTDQTKFLHTRVQQILDAEVHRFDQIAFEFSTKLQKQVDEEVVRVVSASEGAIGRDLESHKDITQRELKNLREDIISMRSSLQAIAAPSNALGSIDSRVDVLRRDVLNLHDAIGKVHEQETRIQSNVSQDTRILIESLRGDILRDVSQHIIRFDQALVELAQENASLRSRLANYEIDDATPATFPITSELATQQQNFSSRVGHNASVGSAPSWGNFRLGGGGPSLHAGGGGSGGNSPGISRSGASTPVPTSPRAGPSQMLDHNTVMQQSRSAVAAMGSVFSRQQQQQPQQHHNDLNEHHSHRPTRQHTATRATRAHGHHHTSASGAHHDSSSAPLPLSSRLESPDRTQIVDRSGLVGSGGGYAQPQQFLPSAGGFGSQQVYDDPLIGVFGEYQASP
ncbi:Hypothetical protein, putative [Bodo saltans]|uniref:Uncharacterized protein n=1 Tax=Bodo saltans TaxID=75058 RepID=A0A0S4J416_BODSA|nr:Hypothetical protein, putative [Bodo saltans]|eukprot:CUG86182.1 Hypothetical protein, putative [Bodo saltans]